MAYQPLTPQQFQAARTAGFTPDKIIANEKIRMQQENAAPADQSPVTADQASAKETGATFAANTTDEGNLHPTEALKTLGNIPSSAFGFAKNVVKAPIQQAKDLAAIPGAFSALSKEKSDQNTAEQGVTNKNNQVIQQYQTLKAAGKDTSHIEAFMKQQGIDPGKIQTAPKASGPVAAAATQFMPSAFKALVPKAAQEALSGDTIGARRDLTNDPVGTILPFIFAAEGGAKALDKSGLTADAAGAVDRGISKVASPVTEGVPKVAEAVSPAAKAVFGKISDAGAAVKNMAKNVVKESYSKLTGLDKSTLKTAAENKNIDLSTVDRPTLGKEVQSALNQHAASLEDTGKNYQPIRELKAVDKSVSPETNVTIKNGKSSYVYDIKDAPNEKLSLPELRQKANLMGKDTSGTYSKADLGTVQDLIKEKETAEPVDHTVKTKSNYLDSSIKKTTGLEIDKEGNLKTSGSASIRDPKDVRALQNLYNTWKPVFEKGNLTTSEFLNFRSDLGKLSKFDREITRSAPLEDLSKKMYSNFNETHRAQIPGLEELDKQFSTQKTELKDMTKGLVDKNGNLTDSGMTKVARATENKPQLMAQLEKIQPGITEKIKILQAAEDLRAASEKFKVGTYGKAIGTGLGFHLLGGGTIPSAIAGLAEMIITNPDNAIKIIQTYSRLAEKFAPYRQILSGALEKAKAAGLKVGTTVNQLPSGRSATLQKVNSFGRQPVLTR